MVVQDAKTVNTFRADCANLFKSIVEIVGFFLYALVVIVHSVYLFFLPLKYHKQKDIKGEVALVTGGGGGLGRLLALRLSKLGAKVVLWDVNTQGLEESLNLIKGLGGNAYAFKCDLSDKDDVYRVAKLTREQVGDVTILINNAGVVSGHLLLDTPDHAIKRTFDVNVIAHFWTVKAFLPHMIARNHGHIVTVASMAGFIGVSKLVDYCSSKYAAVGFDEALRVELESQGVTGVRTTVVCPYFMQQTGMFENVNSRFLPTLKSNDVADKIIEGLRRELTVVMIPGSLAFGISLKSLVPWSLVSVFIRALVPDAAPHPPMAHGKDEKSNGEEFAQSPTKITSLSTSVSQINHRLFSTGKNL